MIAGIVKVGLKSPDKSERYSFFQTDIIEALIELRLNRKRLTSALCLVKLMFIRLGFPRLVIPYGAFSLAQGKLELLDIYRLFAGPAVP